MRLIANRAQAAILLVVLLAPSAMASDWDRGVALYNKAEYRAALMARGFTSRNGRVHLKNLRLEEEHYPQEALVVAQIALVGRHWRVRFNTKLQELLILLGKTVLLSQ